MTLEQLSNAVTFKAFYVASQVGKTGLSPTVDVYNPAGTKIITAAATTEVGGGLYTYTLTSGNTGTEGEYVAIFKTSDTTVDQRDIPALWVIGRAGIEDLDAAISSRSTYAGGAVASVTAAVTVGTNNDKTGYSLSAAGVQAVWDALTSALTTVGSVGKRIADNLDALVSSRASATALATVQADTDDIQTRLPAALVSGRIDASVGAMAANVVTASAIAPDAIGASELAADAVTEIQTGLATAAGVTAATANLDATVSSRSTYAGGAVASVTAPVTVGTNQDKTGYGLSAAAVQAVWDALTSALTTTGSIGKRLADFVDVAVSSRASAADYTATRAAKLDTIGGANVIVTAPVATSGNITIVRGDDYMAADGRALAWTDSAGSWPNLTGATIKLSISAYGGVVDITATCLNPGTAHQQVTADMTAAQSRRLSGSPLRFDVQATLQTSSRVITLVQGLALVSDDVAT